MTEFVESVKYEADISDLKQKLAQVERSTRDAEETTRSSTSNAGTFWSNFGDRVSGAASRVVGAAVDLAKYGAIGLGGLAVAAGTMGLKTAASMETAQIGFETMLGSAKAANSFLGDLQKFAAKTPFEFPELQSAASSLISVGVETSKVIPIMTTLGNVTSGMGTGAEGVKRATIALQQMSAAGRITGEDLNQLRDAGIPVFDLLAAATGKSKEEVAALAQAGKLGKDEMNQLFSALETGRGLERFSGLMEKQSQSLSGMFSTLKDTVNMGLAAAVQPLVPLLSDAIPSAAGLAGTAMDMLKVGLERTIQVGRTLWSQFQDGELTVHGFTENIDYLLGGTGKVAPVLTEIIGVARDLWTVFRDGIVPVFAEVYGSLPSFLTPLGLLRDALGFVADHATTLQPAIAALMAAFGAYRVVQMFTTVMGALNVVMAMNPIGLVVIALAALVAGLVYAWNHSETFRNAVLGAWEAVKGGVAVVGDAIGGIVSWFAALPDRIIDFVKSIPGRVLEFFNTLPGMVGTAIGELVAGFIYMARGLIDFWVELPGRIWDALTSLPGLVWDAFRASLTAARDGLTVAWPLIWEFLKGLPGRIVGAFNGVGDWLWSAGKNLVIGMWNGLVSMQAWIKDKVLDFFKGLLGPIAKALGLGSPSRITAQYGKWLVEGMANGILGNLRMLAGASDAMGAAAFAGLGGGVTGPSLASTANLVGAGGVGLGSSVTIAPIVTVEGSLIHERELGNTVQDALARAMTSTPDPNLVSALRRTTA